MQTKSALENYVASRQAKIQKFNNIGKTVEKQILFARMSPIISLEGKMAM